MSDLDSFFAKKDKKKGKAGKKFATTEEIAKKLEDITLKKDKVKKDKPQSINPDDTNNGNEVSSMNSENASRVLPATHMV